MFKERYVENWHSFDPVMINTEKHAKNYDQYSNLQFAHVLMLCGCGLVQRKVIISAAKLQSDTRSVLWSIITLELNDALI